MNSRSNNTRKGSLQYLIVHTRDTERNEKVPLLIAACFRRPYIYIQYMSLRASKSTNRPRRSLLFSKDPLRIGRRPYYYGGAPPPYSSQQQAGGFTAWTAIFIAAILILLVGLLVLLGLSTHYWAENVERLDRRIDSRKDDLAALGERVDDIDANMPAGDGITFFDNIWRMVNGLDNSKVINFNASLISSLTTHNYAFPDTSGVVLLEETLRPPQTEFPEDVFAVLGVPLSDGKRVEFSLDLLPPGTTRGYQWPNENGTVALVENLSQIMGNASIFLDSVFAIQNDPDTTRVAMFSAAGIATGTTRTYEFPDLDGELLLTTGSQLVQDKDLDTTNDITVFDVSLTIEGIESAESFRFNASELTASRVYRWPDQSGRVLILPNPSPGSGYVEPLWSDPLETIRFPDDGFFISNRANQTRQVRFDLDAVDENTTRTLSVPNLDGEIALTTGEQTFEDKTLGTSNVVELFDVRFTLIDAAGPGFAATFLANILTANRTLFLPDQDDTLATLSDITDAVAVVSNRTVFLDSEFRIESADTGHQFAFDASLLTADRTYQWPDQSGRLLILPPKGPPGVGGGNKRSHEALDGSLVEPLWSNKNATALLRADGIVFVDDTDPEKQCVFTTDLLTPDHRHHVAIPDADGQMVVHNAHQPLRNKVMGPTNNIALYDHRFHIIFDDGQGTGNAMRFDAALLSTNRTLLLPDDNGEIALTTGAQTLEDKTLDTSNDIRVLDTHLNIESADNGHSFRFNASGLNSSHIYRVPNQSGILMVLSNPSPGHGFIEPLWSDPLETIRFPDDAFFISNRADQSRQVRFALDGVDTNISRVLAVPNLDGEIALTTGAQTLEDKTLGSSNTIEILDDRFTLVDGTGAGFSVQFEASLLSVNRTLLLPDQDDTLATLSDLSAAVFSSANRTVFLDSEFRVQSVDSDYQIRFDLSKITQDRMYQLPDTSGRFLSLPFNQGGGNKRDFHEYGGVPLEPLWSDDDTRVLFRCSNMIFANGSAPMKQFMFTTAQLSGTHRHHIAVPAADGDMVIHNAEQTLHNKTLDSSNEVTLSDDGFKLVAGSGKTMRFDASLLTSNRVYKAPNASGTLALQDPVFGFCVGRSTAVSIPLDTWTEPASMTASVTGGHGTQALTSVEGLYQATATVHWDYGSTYRRLRIYDKNAEWALATQSAGSGEEGEYITVSAMAKLPANHDVAVQVYHSGGGEARDLKSVLFCLELVRPL